MAKKSPDRTNGSLGGIDFRTGSIEESASGVSDSIAGLDSGNDNGSIGAGDNGDKENGGRNETINGYPSANPGDFGNAEDAPYGRRADGTPRKAPGRKPGSGSGGSSRASPSRSSGKAQAASGQSVDGLQRLLFSIHMMGAAFLKTPEIAIEAKEAAMLAQAVSDVQSHYNFDVSHEVTIWTNLVIAAASIYGPRAVAIAARKKSERSPKQRPAATVTPINANVSPDTSGMTFGFNIPTE